MVGGSCRWSPIRTIYKYIRYVRTISTWAEWRMSFLLAKAHKWSCSPQQNTSLVAVHTCAFLSARANPTSASGSLHCVASSTTTNENKLDISNSLPAPEHVEHTTSVPLTISVDIYIIWANNREGWVRQKQNKHPRMLSVTFHMSFWRPIKGIP